MCVHVKERVYVCSVCMHGSDGVLISALQLSVVWS